MLRGLSAKASPAQSSSSPERQWFAWLPLAAAGFTTLCCLGASAALSLATTVAATFLTRDSALRPLLAATLALTVSASGLTYWRHRRLGPLVLTAIAAAWIYTVIFLVGGTHGGHDQASHTDHMAGRGSQAAHAGLSGSRITLVWTGLALLVATQDWDYLGTRRRRSVIAS